MVARAAFEVHHHRADVTGARVRDRLHRAFQLGRLRCEARNDRRHQHAGVDPGIDELAHGTQPLERVGRAGLEPAPAFLVDRRHAEIDAALGSCTEIGEHVPVAQNHRALGDNADRRGGFGEALDRAAGEPIRALDRLVRIGGGAERDLLAPPGRAMQLVAQPRHEVGLDEDQRRELIVGVELELRLVAAREAVVTAVGAAAIGVERPLERHSADPVEGRTAADFTIRRLVGAAGAADRFNAAGLDQAGDVSGGGEGEVREERRLFHRNPMNIGPVSLFR